MNIVLAQLSPEIIIIPDHSDEKLLEFLTNEYGTSITIIKIANKEFLFDKGRIRLLNWYINYINLQKERHNFQESVLEDNEIANYKIHFRDHEEGIKTHAYLQMEGLIELDQSQLTIGCAGVLLMHLQKIQQERDIQKKGESGVESEVIQPTVIKAFSCDKYMQVNSDTMQSLCIFSSERHPNMHQSREKESLSLFGILSIRYLIGFETNALNVGLLDKTTSVLGKQMLKEWVSRPIRDKQALENRHASISLFMASDMRDTTTTLRVYLGHIKNINRLLVRVRESKAKVSDWQYILKFAYYTICIFRSLQPILNSQYFQFPLIQKFKSLLPKVNLMQKVGTNIDNVIDFGASKEKVQIIVKQGIDSELDALREQYEKLDDTLLQVSQEVGSILPIGLSAALNVVYFPQLGYLITLPQYHLQRNSGISITDSGHSKNSNITEYYQQNLPGYELQFSTADNLYYKNERTKELDANLGDLYAMISDREIEIMQELSAIVLEYTVQFLEISNALSELDCILSLAIVALQFNYVKPKLTLDNSLDIVKGRHPIQELSVDVFISNHTHLKGGQGFKNQRPGNNHSSVYDNLRKSSSTSRINTSSRGQTINNDTNSVQVVTGANFSGKSVYLKQVALITYMAHIGSFIPAERATIGITDKIFTRIQTSETVLKPQSAFGFDLQQINRALQNATCQSLIIIDEFGKGTDISDGAALFCSVLGYFLSKREQCPKIIASTHFHDLVCKNFFAAQDGITLSQTEITSQNVRGQASCASGEGQNRGDLLSESALNKENEVVFLYRIVPGNGDTKSHGLWCASIAGLPSHTIGRAEYLSRKFKNTEPIERIQTKQEEEKYKLLEQIYISFTKNNNSELSIREVIPAIESIFLN
ncbi:hypothetical protein INT46_009809 [Mucor plumbeus]|uniref:DNA mismatch repair proteins mutS family domain-containing protein n=1 Tax=Mucor plumbeus TaxID=97098 RepID=A0A8H7QI05_9FUNG|nr:hypothetical protein INT46_009809 [Mucor plumbeus]